MIFTFIRSCAFRTTAAALFFAVMAQSGAEATTTVTCEPSKVKAVAQTSNTNRITSSNTFVDVPATSVTINQGGNSNSCVIVDFSGLVATAMANAFFLRALLDDVAGEPDYGQITVNTTQNQSRSISFIFPNVAPGTHTVKLQFRSSTNGQNVYINRGTMIIRYAP